MQSGLYSQKMKMLDAEILSHHEAEPLMRLIWFIDVNGFGILGILGLSIEWGLFNHFRKTG